MMNIKEAYDTWSSSYDTDENLTRDLDATVTRRSLKGLRFESILEIGCGTGKNTGLLSRIGERVHAVDFSRGMLTIARGRVRAQNVSFAIVDLAITWPYANRQFDLVTCNLVLEHLPGLAHVFAEAARSLRPQGRFFICELHPFRQYQGKQAVFQGGAQQIRIPACLHNLSEFLDGAAKNGLSLLELREWWHPDDRDETPRLVSFSFVK